MKIRSFASLATLTGLVSLMPFACSSEPPARDRNNNGGSGNTSGSGGSGADSGSVTNICTAGEGCNLIVTNGPSGSGSECVAFRDNADGTRIQLRQTWTRLTKPVGTTTDTFYSILLTRSYLRIPSCWDKGVSGYVKLLDFDLSGDISQHTLRIGWADWVTDPGAAVDEGLCFVTLNYTDPAHGLNDTWRVEPVVATRLEDDFTVDNAFRATVPEGEGRFYYNETTGETHIYQKKAFVVAFDNEAKLIAVPIHDVEERGRFNDPTAPNCMGAYRADAMSEGAQCFSASQTNPPWGCHDGSCPAGEGPVSVTGYFKIEEIEKVYATVLKQTLCVSYQGQQNAVDAGWADLNASVVSCQSGTKTFDPSLPDDAGLPAGDWCSRDNVPATPTCHDAFRSVATSVYAAFPIRDDTCATTAGAGL